MTTTHHTTHLSEATMTTTTRTTPETVQVAGTTYLVPEATTAMEHAITARIGHAKVRGEATPAEVEQFNELTARHTWRNALVRAARGQREGRPDYGDAAVVRLAGVLQDQGLGHLVRTVSAYRATTEHPRPGLNLTSGDRLVVVQHDDTPDTYRVAFYTGHGSTLWAEVSVLAGDAFTAAGAAWDLLAGGAALFARTFPRPS